MPECDRFALRSTLMDNNKGDNIFNAVHFGPWIGTVSLQIYKKFMSRHRAH